MPDVDPGGRKAGLEEADGVPEVDPGGGKVGLEEADGVPEVDPGGGGYLKRSEGLGLWGLNILKGSTVGLSPSSVREGLLRKSSSSEIPLLRSIRRGEGRAKGRWVRATRHFPAMFPRSMETAPRSGVTKEFASWTNGADGR